MIFLYVAPRFHPNQYPILEGLINKGHQVFFLASKEGDTEKHGLVHHILLKPSRITIKMIKKWKKNGDVYAENKSIFWFIPDKKELIELVNQIKPDIVIVRDRNLLSLFTVNICRQLGVKKILLYNQSPVYSVKKKWYKNIQRKLWFSLFPKKRITVCRYYSYPNKETDYICDKNAFFLPLVPRNVLFPNRIYMHNNRVNIFDCGKYRKYKNHLLLIEAIHILRERGFDNFFVTILGQANHDEEIDYYFQCKNLINQYNLEKWICLENCVPYDEIPNYYFINDVFVLPSSSEQASVSVLDSLSFGLVTISTSRNGTSDYVEPGKTGEIFETNDANDLADKISIYLSNPDVISVQGTNAIQSIKENFSFESYYEKLMQIIESL